MILLIDNYDSFSYNLFQLVGSINPDIEVVRNDQLSAQEVLKKNPSHIIISPGPGKPSDAGFCISIIKAAAGNIPILGVCLGHQAICEAFGATVSYADELMHGKQSEVTVDRECRLFKGLTDRIKVARYHSLIALGDTMPDTLLVTAKTDKNEVMAVAHKEFQVYGVQFHPESILTPQGGVIINNFLEIKE